MRSILLAVAALSFSAFSTSLLAQCPDAEAKRLEDLDHAWSEATQKGDRAALSAIVADNFTGITATGTTSKSDVIDAAVSAAEAARTGARPAPRVVYDNYIIACTPTTATVTHRNAVTSTENGKDVTSYSRSVHVLEKRGDKWQVVSNAGHGLDERATLLYLERDWNQTEMKQDASWFERTLADDYTGVDARTGKPTTKIQTVADLKTTTTAAADLSGLDVKLQGDTAVVTGVSHNKGKDDKGAAFDRRIRFTDVWVKRDGKWQVLSSHGTDVK
jgi:ketosteroid isomerase-like protein